MPPAVLPTRQVEPSAHPGGRASAPRRGAPRDAAAEPDTARLMRAVQAGDDAAYAALLRQVIPMLRAVARRRIRDAAEAEDALQDTLLTVHQLRASYDPERPIRPWLVAICERRCIDRLRRRGRRQNRETAIDGLEHVLAASGTPGTDGEGRVAAAQLHAAIADLPQSQRVALRLAKLEDLPLADASARSGLSVGALKVATHRALRTLRRRMVEMDAVA